MLVKSSMKVYGNHFFKVSTLVIRFNEVSTAILDFFYSYSLHSLLLTGCYAAM